MSFLSYDPRKHISSPCDVDLRFDPLLHIYSLYGVALSSVNQLLTKHKLATDYSKVDQSFLKPYADKGKMIHAEIEDWINRGTTGFTPEFMSFVTLVDKFGIIPYCAEEIVYTNWLAGTIDIVGLIDNGQVKKNVIIDIKTGSKIYMTALRWQLSLYRRLSDYQEDEFLLYCMHLHDDIAELILVEPIPDTEIDELFRCERDGELYVKEEGLVSRETTDAMVVLSDYMEDLAREVKVATAKMEDFKADLQKLMLDKSIKSFENDFFKITLVLKSTTNTFDSKSFQAKHPELYGEFIKTGTKAGYVKITRKAEEVVE